MQKTFVLVSHHQGLLKREEYETAVAADSIPRQDYFELAAALNAAVVQPRAPKSLAWLEQRLRLNLFESWATLRQLPDGARVLSTSEKIALPLAMLTAVTRRPRHLHHVAIGHKLSSGGKTRLFRWWSPAHQVAHMVCLSRPQVAFAIEALAFPPTRVSFVPDKVDQLFFRPMKLPEEPYVLAVGSEQRDYQTLMQAMAGTGLDLVLVGSSLWNQNATLPEVPGTRIYIKQNIPFKQLRDLYARASLVVLPLHPVDYAAGVNSLLEPMAMAKGIVITQTAGIDAYVREGETAVTVPPHNTPALRDAILSLWQQPELRQQLGDNARQAVEDGLNLDNYVAQIANLLGSKTVSHVT